MARVSRKVSSKQLAKATIRTIDKAYNKISKDMTISVVDVYMLLKEIAEKAEEYVESAKSDLDANGIHFDDFDNIIDD